MKNTNLEVVSESEKKEYHQVKNVIEDQPV